MQAVGHAAAQQRQLDEGVVAAGLALAQQKVVGVAGPGLRVGAVGALELDRLDADVVKVELADVGDRAALDGVVGESGGAVVDDGFFGGGLVLVSSHICTSTGSHWKLTIIPGECDKDSLWRWLVRPT